MNIKTNENFNTADIRNNTPVKSNLNAKSTTEGSEKTFNTNNEGSNNFFTGQNCDTFDITNFNTTPKNIVLSPIYDPYDYCTSEKPITYSDTFLHLMKFSIGTGILALPSAFASAGCIIGVIGGILVALLNTYCVHLFLSAEYELCRQRKIPNLTYARTVHAAFEDGPKRLRWLASYASLSTNVIFIMYLLGVSAAFTIFVSKNINNLWKHYFEYEINIRVLIVLLTIFFIFLCFIQNLKIFVPLTTAANSMIFIGLLIVLRYILNPLPSFENRRIYGKIADIPKYINTFQYAIGIATGVIPLKNNMLHPRRFNSKFGVLNMSMIPITLLYAIFGLLGYLKYGDDILASITLNLPQNEFPAQIVTVLYTLSIFISYFIIFYIVFDIVWINYFKNKIKNHNLLLEYSLRACYPLIASAMACTLPNLGAVISLVGAIGTGPPCLLIPVIVHVLVFSSRFKTKFDFFKYCIKMTLLFLISFFIIATGTRDSVIDIIQSKNTK